MNLSSGMYAVLSLCPSQSSRSLCFLTHGREQVSTRHRGQRYRAGASEHTSHLRYEIRLHTGIGGIVTNASREDSVLKKQRYKRATVQLTGFVPGLTKSCFRMEVRLH